MKTINKLAFFTSLITVCFVLGGVVGCTKDLYNSYHKGLEKPPESGGVILDIKPI